ncbi:hypothetical protein C2U70_08215 [Bradyrhizobium guangdongense]|nr:hypothetical protein C2U70_08215 [Bradyrhizobium guangdongense]
MSTICSIALGIASFQKIGLKQKTRRLDTGGSNSVVAVRNTNPQRIRRYVMQVEKLLPAVRDRDVTPRQN